MIEEKIKESKIKSDVELTDEEKEEALKIFEAFKMPIKIKDEDIDFGAGELDITGLSNEKIYQLFFRTQIATNLYLKEMSATILDFMRLFILFLYKKCDVKDITSELQSTLDKISEESKKITNN